ncbi:hypothetical protein H8S62_12750 [Lawsonibacter sp. NSJ-52]|uniref:Integrase SAM-like N-terminal domain-containing protein n=1 Tax=Lawsonibacter faecis TaxID=2763052 RepID=A0A8J6JN78_9FIRM|nr:hypothetical protein [Lawsonibacter faecis]
MGSGRLLRRWRRTAYLPPPPTGRARAWDGAGKRTWEKVQKKRGTRKKPTTYENYGYTLNILNVAFGGRKLDSIKALDVEQFLKSLRAAGKSDSSLAKCRGML